MGVYIKGIDMPKENELIYLCIDNEGIVECVKSIAGSRDGEEPTTLIEMEQAKATYIPEPHGRLIDANGLKGELAKAIPNYIIDTKSRWFTEGLGRANIEIDDAPTIIEGSEEMSSKLKPCPFCGEIPTHKYNEQLKKWYIQCENENCRIQPFTDAHVNKSVITREWNKRTKERK